MIPRVVAVHDPALRARVVRTMPLHYAGGADAAVDRPAHVRAGSGVAWIGDSLVIVQDDASFLAVVDPGNGAVAAIPLPAAADGRRQFDDRRGNKADKLDLESIVSVPRADRGDEAILLAVGSGSTARRESIAIVRGLGAVGAATDAAVEVLAVPAFYARLREARRFAGSELNVEAVVHLGTARGGDLRLFNRGNGARRDGLVAVDATCDVRWEALSTYLASECAGEPPVPSRIVQYDLGAIGGHRLTFTDASLVPAVFDDGRRIVYTATAEASPDVTRDGPVAGSAVGVIAEGPDGIRVRWTVLRDDAGAPFPGKVEGVALDPDDPMRAYVVVDRDVPDEPAELCEVLLAGPWFADGG